MASYTMDFRTGSARSLSRAPSGDDRAGLIVGLRRTNIDIGPGAVAQLLAGTTAVIEALELRDVTDHPEIADAVVALARVANPLVWATSGGEPEFNSGTGTGW